MAVVDPAFEALLARGGEDRAELWRVQNMQLVPVHRSLWGTFYSGDCYLLFNGGNVHFWIGSESSVDEQAVAAIKSVELDTLFGGVPVQYREVQGHESKRFKAAFPEGLVIKLGGMESGLRKTSRDVHQARMFQVSGGKRPTLTEVPIAWSSMNHGDVFVVDTGNKIFVWAGAESSGHERMAAGMVASRLRDHVGEEIVHVTDGEEEEEVGEDWIKVLPLDRKGDVKGKDDRRDARIGDQVTKSITLHKVSDVTGSMKTELVKTGELSRSDLEGEDAFLVSAGELGVWVWLGRRSSAEERRAAMELGERFIRESGLPRHTALTRVAQGGEPGDFTSLFKEGVTW